MLELHPPLCLSTLSQHMVPIKGGIFEMGGESILDNAKPNHKVKLDDFEICRYPVSQQLWYEVMGKIPERLKFENPHRPVERISWVDIQEEFLPALWEKTGDYTYCLPTEAQWEYAARGGIYAQAFTYAGSNQVKEGAWYRENSFSETNLIGCKRPNALGLYDMSGNVWEWCQDRFDAAYYQTLTDQYGTEPAPNPQGPEEGNSRVVRGGSWSFSVNDCRVSGRSDLPDLRVPSIGFRLCRYSPR